MLRSRAMYERMATEARMRRRGWLDGSAFCGVQRLRGEGLHEQFADITNESAIDMLDHARRNVQ